MLRRDLSHEKTVHEKEMEEFRKRMEERYNSWEKEAVQRLAVEKAHIEGKLAWTEDHWSEVLRRGQEDHARELERARQSESLWTKLVRMMTWS